MFVGGFSAISAIDGGVDQLQNAPVDTINQIPESGFAALPIKIPYTFFNGNLYVPAGQIPSHAIFCCPECDFQTTCVQDLKLHQEEHDAGSIPSVSSPPPEDTAAGLVAIRPKRKVQKSDRFICKVCGKRFSSYGQMYFHGQAHKEPAKFSVEKDDSVESTTMTANSNLEQEEYCFKIVDVRSCSISDADFLDGTISHDESTLTTEGSANSIDSDVDATLVEEEASANTMYSIDKATLADEKTSAGEATLTDEASVGNETNLPDSETFDAVSSLWEHDLDDNLDHRTLILEQTEVGSVPHKKRKIGEALATGCSLEDHVSVVNKSHRTLILNQTDVGDRLQIGSVPHEKQKMGDMSVPVAAKSSTDLGHVVPKMFRCSRCLFTTFALQSCMDHMEAIHGSTINAGSPSLNYRCSRCDFASRSWVEMKRHQASEHRSVPLTGKSFESSLKDTASQCNDKSVDSDRHQASEDLCASSIGQSSESTIAGSAQTSRLAQSDEIELMASSVKNTVRKCNDETMDSSVDKSTIAVSTENYRLDLYDKIELTPLSMKCAVSKCNDKSMDWAVAILESTDLVFSVGIELPSRSTRNAVSECAPALTPVKNDPAVQISSKSSSDGKSIQQDSVAKSGSMVDQGMFDQPPCDIVLLTSAENEMSVNQPLQEVVILPVRMETGHSVVVSEEVCEQLPLNLIRPACLDNENLMVAGTEVCQQLSQEVVQPVCIENDTIVYEGVYKRLPQETIPPVCMGKKDLVVVANEVCDRLPLDVTTPDRTENNNSMADEVCQQFPLDVTTKASMNKKDSVVEQMNCRILDSGSDPDATLESGHLRTNGAGSCSSLLRLVKLCDAEQKSAEESPVPKIVEGVVNYTSGAGIGASGLRSMKLPGEMQCFTELQNNVGDTRHCETRVEERSIGFIDINDSPSIQQKCSKESPETRVTAGVEVESAAIDLVKGSKSRDTPARFRCCQCQFVTSDLQSSLEHLQKVHGVGYEDSRAMRYRCRVCHLMSTSLLEMKRHKLIAHSHCPPSTQDRIPEPSGANQTIQEQSIVSRDPVSDRLSINVSGIRMEKVDLVSKSDVCEIKQLLLKPSRALTCENENYSRTGSDPDSINASATTCSEKVATVVKSSVGQSSELLSQALTCDTGNYSRTGSNRLPINASVIRMEKVALVAKSDVCELKQLLLQPSRTLTCGTENCIQTGSDRCPIDVSASACSEKVILGAKSDVGEISGLLRQPNRAIQASRALSSNTGNYSRTGSDRRPINASATTCLEKGALVTKLDVRETNKRLAQSSRAMTSRDLLLTHEKKELCRPRANKTLPYRQTVYRPILPKKDPNHDFVAAPILLNLLQSPQGPDANVDHSQDPKV